MVLSKIQRFFMSNSMSIWFLFANKIQLLSSVWVLMSIKFSFPTKIQSLLSVVGWRQANIALWRQRDFHFQTKLNIYPMLGLTSSQHWLLTAIRLSFLTKVYSLFNVGDWHQSNFYNQNSTSVQCWKLASGQHWVLTST